MISLHETLEIFWPRSARNLHVSSLTGCRLNGYQPTSWNIIFIIIIMTLGQAPKSGHLEPQRSLSYPDRDSD